MAPVPGEIILIKRVDQRMSTFIDGRWVKETVKIPAWLKDQPEPQLAQPPSAPKLGLLTHTVVQSPVYHWTLPTTHDGGKHSDIAFIGDHSIVIRRLDDSGKQSMIYEVCNIRLRIRNAAALRASQRLVLVLENGDLLFVSNLDRLAEGVEPLFTLSQDASMGIEFHGEHIATDPTSRFVAVTRSQNQIRVEDVRGLQSTAEAPDWNIEVKGRIIKMDFLHPPSGDPNLVVLAVIASINGEFRVHDFQWDARRKHPRVSMMHGRMGFRLQTVQVPQLLIPLTDAGPGAFLLVFESTTCLCKGLLSALLKETWCDLLNIAPTVSHRSLRTPVWVSWSKPHGRSNCAIIREDGVWIKIESTGAAKLTSDAMLTGPVKNVATVTLKDSKKNADEITYWVYGRETGTGRVALVNQPLYDNHTAVLANWDPLNDFVATPASRQEPPYGTRLPIITPGKTYGCSGMGSEGPVSELSRKVEAFVRFTFSDEDFQCITGMWAAPFWEKPGCSAVALARPPAILISFRNCSVLLARGVGDELLHIPQEKTWLDLSSKTFAAFFEKDCSFQLTAEKLMVRKVVDGVENTRSVGEILGPFAPFGPPHGGTILDAVTNGQDLCIYTQSPTGARTRHLFAFNRPIGASSVLPVLRNRREVSEAEYPSCSAMSTMGDHAVAFARGYFEIPSSHDTEESMRGAARQLYVSMDGFGVGKYAVMAGLDAKHCVSLGILSNGNDPLSCLVLAGHRDGVLSGWYCTITDTWGTPVELKQERSFYKRLGKAEVQVCVDFTDPSRALVSSGRDVYHISYDWTSTLPLLTKVAVSIPEHLVTHPHQPSSAPPRTLIANYNDGFLLATGGQIIDIKLGEKTAGFVPLQTPESPPIPPNNLPGPATTMLASSDLGGLVLAGTILDKNGLIAGPALLGSTFDGSSITSLFGFISKKSTSSDLPKEIITCLIEFKKPQPRLHGTAPLILAGTSRGALNLVVCPLDRLPEYQKKKFSLTASAQMDGPIHAMLQSPLDPWCVYLCVGETVQLIKFSPLKLGRWKVKIRQSIHLESKGVAMSFVKQDDGKFHQLVVLTALHSAVMFAVHKAGAPDAEGPDPEGRIDANTIIFGREMRNGFDMHPLPTPAEGGHLILVSDKDCGVTALWENDSTQALGTVVEYEKILEAELLVSIKKFRLVDAVRMWDSDTKSDGLLKDDILAHPLPIVPPPLLPWAAPPAPAVPGLRKELLGTSLNGSVIQFTVIKPELFFLLAVLQHFAGQVPEMSPIPPRKSKGGPTEEESDREFYFSDPLSGGPSSTHINGDLIKEWLRRRRGLANFLVEHQMKMQHKLSWKILIFVSAVRKFRPEWLAENDMGDEDKPVSLAKKGWNEEDTEVLEGLARRVYDVLECLFRPVV